MAFVGPLTESGPPRMGGATVVADLGTTPMGASAGGATRAVGLIEAVLA